jgi:hypothetical protein
MMQDERATAGQTSSAAFLQKAVLRFLGNARRIESP